MRLNVELIFILPGDDIIASFKMFAWPGELASVKRFCDYFPLALNFLFEVGGQSESESSPR